MAFWSSNYPVSVMGAWINASGYHEPDDVFARLARKFSTCRLYDSELQAYDVAVDTDYTIGHVLVTVDGEPRSFVLRAT